MKNVLLAVFVFASGSFANACNLKVSNNSVDLNCKALSYSETLSTVQAGMKLNKMRYPNMSVDFSGNIFIDGKTPEKSIGELYKEMMETNLTEILGGKVTCVASKPVLTFFDLTCHQNP